MSRNPRRPALLVFLTILFIGLAGDRAHAETAKLEEFFGAYVGTATVTDRASETVEQRDMDIVIEPFRNGGFRIVWINVTLVDGRRDVPGVQRRVEEVIFTPSSRAGLYTEEMPRSLFEKRPELNPMQGQAVRWARIEDRTLRVYSFAVLQDGGYELQVYDRILTEQGLDILFGRIVNGTVLRQISGHTVRAR